MLKGFPLKRVAGAKNPTNERKFIEGEFAVFTDLPEVDQNNWQYLEKSEEERELITLANQVTNDILQECGLPPFDIPPENVLVLQDASYREDGQFGNYDDENYTINVHRQNVALVFFHTLVHEMLHFKSYQAYQKMPGKNGSVENYRAGLTVYSRDVETQYLNDLNEAVTEELTKRVSSKYYSQNQKLQAERDSTREEIKRLVTEECYSEDEFEDALYVEDFGWQEPLCVKTYAYQDERLALEVLITHLYAKNNDQFQSEHEVFMVFAKAMLSGNLLPLARLIDNTFGRKSFNRLAKGEDGASLNWLVSKLVFQQHA